MLPFIAVETVSSISFSSTFLGVGTFTGAFNPSFEAVSTLGELSFTTFFFSFTTGLFFSSDSSSTLSLHCVVAFLSAKLHHGVDGSGTLALQAFEPSALAYRVIVKVSE